MILPGNASLILSVAQQLIKLDGRIDSLLAEKTAVQSQLVLGMPAVVIVDATAQIQLVRAALLDTATLQPDPFGTDRPVLNTHVNPGPPTAGFAQLFQKYFPDTSLLIDPDGDYLDQLAHAFPGLDWKDPAVRIAAFAVMPGRDDRQIGYNARLGLAVADTLCEFGANNTALLVRDENLRGILQVVLQRLAQPEWDNFEQWGPLLKTALKAVINAGLDVADKLPADNPWLAGLLDALTQARSAAPQPDDYLLGLLQGKGVPLFLSKGLLVASTRLADVQSDVYGQIAADVLKAAAPLVQNAANPSFGEFFNDHWGDLLRAGLTSLDQHGDVLLQGANPLLRDTLKAMVQQLAQTADANFLTNETLYRLANAAIGVVADNPGEITGLESKPWLRDFIAAAAQSAKQLTAQKLFTKDAAEALVLDAVGVLAKYPSLIIKQQGLPLTLTTDVLTAVAGLKRLDARSVGEAAIRAALTAIANDPTLAAGKFGPAVTTIASRLATLVGTGKISGAQAAAIAIAAVEATARNPQLFAELQKDIAAVVVEAIQTAISDISAPPWASRLLIPLASEALLAVARSGGPAAANQPVAQFQQLLTSVLTGGLQLAATELGRSIDLPEIPPVLGGLLSRALRGDLTEFKPSSTQFASAFGALAAALPRS